MKKVLVVIDMQNDFVDGVLGNAECQAVVPKIVDIIKNNDFDEIYMTRDTHQDNYLNTQEGRNLPIKHCIQYSEGWKIVEDIEKAAEGKKFFVVDKPSFGSMYLASLLKEQYFLEQEDVEFNFVGVCTGICVISNVMLIKAALPESKINVIADACACVTSESHQTALDAMKMCQINIV